MTDDDLEVLSHKRVGEAPCVHDWQKDKFFSYQRCTQCGEPQDSKTDRRDAKQ